MLNVRLLSGSVMILSSVCCAISCSSPFNTNEVSRPFKDAVYQGGAQNIPGTLECEYFDFGGEGIAYHDADSINSGSGVLNISDGSYLHEFRKDEAVDISYTKFTDPPIDNTKYNFVQTKANQLYVGWTEPGEWIKYTIHVQKSGIYKLGIMYTANQDGKIAFSVDGKQATNPLLIPNTFVKEDSIDYRQWHHWNYLDSLTNIKLKKGIHTLTLHTLEKGSMNYDYINFHLLK